jgi:anaerobic selenocysteine-containing dehydrogenase
MVTLDAGAVTAIRGDVDDPLSRGHLCPKALALADLHADPDRLRRPLRRDTSVHDGESPDAWQEIEWDEAFDLVADRLAATIQSEGRDAVGIYLGNPNVHSLGAMTHGGAMAKAIGTRNRFSATSVDQLPHQLVAHLMFGHQLLLPVPDVDRTSYFLVFGANPIASHGSLMTAPDLPRRLKELSGRGGRLVVVDPRRTETARIADEHVFIRPGTDAWVLLAMLQVMFADGLAQEPTYAAGSAAVRDAVAAFTPEAAALVSGVPAETIRRLTHEFAQAETGVAYGRIGVSAQEFGTVCQWAINCLNLLTGNLDRVGGAMFTTPAIDLVGSGMIGRGHFDRWQSRVRGLPETSGELPVAALREEIETPGAGQITALLTVAGNPVLSTPDGHSLDRALSGLRFMVSIDPYLNETTRHADVILPPTMALERDHYDLVFNTLAVRNTARFTPAVIAKPAGARHDWEIFREVTLRTLARLDEARPLRARLALQLRLRLSPTRLLSVLLRRGSSGLTLRALRRQPSGVDLGPLQAGQFPGRLQTRIGKLELAPHLVLADLDRLRATVFPAPHELVLIGRRHRQDCNSWLHNSPRLTRGAPRHHLLMHPEDLAERGLEDGAVVAITSVIGRVETEVKATTDLMRGVVSLPHGYGHQRSSVGQRNAASVAGVSINDLTDPGRLDVSGNAALTGVRVTVTAP